MELIYGPVGDHVDIIPSKIYLEECLIDRWVDGKLVGANYIPGEFSGDDIDQAITRINNLYRLVPRYD